jgi:hypothetical protein
MAIETPLLHAKAQIQEQGKQQRKTQQQRFIQNLGQTIVGSALELGTTLGVEHFKETRPSVQTRTNYMKKLTEQGDQALTEAKGRWAEFSTPEARAARERAREQSLTKTQQEITASTAKLNQTRLLAAEANLHIDDEGNFYFLGDTPAPPLDLGTSGGVDYAAMAKAPGLHGTESSAGFPRAFTDERFEKEDKALEPRKIFVNTPEGIARGQKEIEALRKSIVKMGFVKPGEAKNMSVNTILGTMQMSFSKQFRPRGPVRGPSMSDRAEMTALYNMAKPLQKHWQSEGGASYGSWQEWIEGDPASARLTKQIPQMRKMINRLKGLGEFRGMSVDEALWSIIQQGEFDPAETAGRATQRAEQVFDEFLEMPPGTTRTKFSGIDWENPEHMLAFNKVMGVQTNRHTLNPTTGEVEMIIDGPYTGKEVHLKGLQGFKAWRDHLREINNDLQRKAGFLTWSPGPNERIPLHDALIPHAQAAWYNVMNATSHLISSPPGKTALPSQLLNALGTNFLTAGGVFAPPPTGPGYKGIAPPTSR